MDTSTEEIYFQKLQELIEDEDKIVTVTSFANALKISVQDSAKLLNQFFNDNRKLKPDELAATYILTGTLKNSKNVVSLVKDCDIPSKKEQFEDVNSEILYSIQKNKVVDFNIIALVDWSNIKNIEEKPKPLLGTVVSKNCTKRTWNFKILPPPVVPAVKGKSTLFAPKTEPKVNGNLKEVENVTSKTISKTKSGTISNLFSKATESKKETAEIKKEPEEKPTSNIKSSKGSLSSFFSKTPSNISSHGSIKSAEFEKKQDLKENGSIKSENGETSESKIDENKSSEDIDFGSDIEMKESEISQVEKKSNTTKTSAKKSKKETKKSSKRTRENSEDKNTKRRKRIIETNDSDSDDMFGNDENDEEYVEKSDDEQPKSPSPVTVKPLAPKNKRRVAVDRTYIDEEGFLVTNKEYVLVSASEDEDEKLPAQPEKKEVKPSQKTVEKKQSVSSETDTSPQKGGKGKKGKKNVLQNQPTLMNFFKKK